MQPRIVLRSLLIQKKFGAEGRPLAEPFEKIADHARQFLEPLGLSRFVSLELDDDLRAQLRLHPSEDTSRLTLEGNEIVFDISTRIAGPGFHRMAILFLDSLSSEFGLEWYAKEGDLGDALGYRDNRDFQDLQFKTRIWLKQIATRVVEADKRISGHTNVWLHQELGRSLMRFPDGIIATPYGLRSRSFFEALAQAEISSTTAEVQENFAWWDEEISAEHWLKVGMHLLWVEVQWRVPAIGNDREIYELALYCFEKARHHSPSISIPDKEIQEARALLESDQRWLKPNQEGIGYFRQTLWRRLAQNWATPLPGYWHWSVDDSSVAYWFDDITVEASFINVKPEPGHPDTLDFLLETNHRQIERKVGRTEAYAIEVTTFDHQGERKPHIVGHVVRRTSTLIVSVFVLKDEDIEFAKSVVRRTRWIEA